MLDSESWELILFHLMLHTNVPNLICLILAVPYERVVCFEAFAAQQGWCHKPVTEI